MDNISLEYVQNNLDVLAQQAEKGIRHHLSLCDEKINDLWQWKNSAINPVSSTNDTKLKKVKKSMKFKVGKSVSLSGKQRFTGKRKLTFLNACSTHLLEIQNNIEEAPKISKDIRQTRSMSKADFNNILSFSKPEVLMMHSELTLKCNKFLSASQENMLADTLQKSSEELLECCGIQGKSFVERSLNETRFPKLKTSASDLGNSQKTSSGFHENNKPEIIQQHDKTFEVLSVNNKIADSNCQSIKQNKFINANLLHVKQFDENKTPTGKHTPGVTSGISAKSAQSDSGTPVIKKKNLTSYLHVKSIMSNVKYTPVSSELSSKTVKNKGCLQEPVVSASKPVNNNGRQLRNLRSRLPCSSETKPVPKKTTKRTRVKDSPDEVKNNKRKQREENVKQKKLDLQLKKEEKKQQREERMRKTKEAREKLEQERREKLQSSEEKRHCVDANKELVPKKKTRVAHQTQKLQPAKQTAPVLKVTKAMRKSNRINSKTKKLKKPSLVTVNEIETDTETTSSNTSPKSSTYILNKNKSANVVNSTFTLKNTPVETLNVTAENIKVCLPQNSVSNSASGQTSSHCPSNATYIASKTPEEAVKPVTPFKVPNVTPKQNSKSALKTTSGNSKRISNDVSYELTPYRDEDEDSLDEDETKKPIPSWASGIRLKEAIIKQACYPPDLNKLFGKISEKIDLAEIFGSQRRKNYKKRTSSAVWRNISFNLNI